MRTEGHLEAPEALRSPEPLSEITYFHSAGEVDRLGAQLPCPLK